MKSLHFLFILPLLLFIGLCLFLWRGLSLNPRQLPSTLIQQPVPAFSLPDLLQAHHLFTNQSLQGHLSLLNIWATWCMNCRLEHPILMDIAHLQHISIYGIDYKDDKMAAKQWLAQYGNPYQAIGFDQTGETAINLGVYGTPETFIIDANGKVRYKYIGPITETVWHETLLPEIKKLHRETSP